jgi:elongation factor P hydroxylase|tara:strand:+ start:952 stop:1308 length:357 start_codon:yes stop_codon:yes gene_type:complete
MFSKLTLQERYYIFVSICLVWMMGHQSYYTYRADELIHEALEEGNNLVNRYNRVNDELQQENTGLKHNLIHEQVMHQASKGHRKMLEGQINAISNYYRKEIVKVNDELFDLKHKEKDE